MENNSLTKDDVIQLIYASEDNNLARKVLSIFLQQQTDIWNDECYNLVAEKASRDIRDQQEISKV